MYNGTVREEKENFNVASFSLAYGPHTARAASITTVREARPVSMDNSEHAFVEELLELSVIAPDFRARLSCTAAHYKLENANGVEQSEF